MGCVCVCLWACTSPSIWVTGHWEIKQHFALHP